MIRCVCRLTIWVGGNLKFNWDVSALNFLVNLTFQFNNSTLNAMHYNSGHNINYMAKSDRFCGFWILRDMAFKSPRVWCHLWFQTLPVYIGMTSGSTPTNSSKFWFIIRIGTMNLKRKELEIQEGRTSKSTSVSLLKTFWG